MNLRFYRRMKQDEQNREFVRAQIKRMINSFGRAAENEARLRIANRLIKYIEKNVL